MSEARASLTRRVSIALFRSEAVFLLAVLALATVVPTLTGANAQTANKKMGVGQFSHSLGAKDV